MIRHIVRIILSAAAAVTLAAWVLSYRGVDPVGPTSLEKLDDFRRRLPARKSPKGWAMERSVGEGRSLSFVGFRGRLAMASFVEIDASAPGSLRRKRWAGLSSESYVQRPSGGHRVTSSTVAVSDKDRRQAATYAVERVTFPLWIPFALLSFYPAVSVPAAALRRRRRRRRGLCVRCGYDLKGASGERCSECGTTRPPDRLREAISETGARPRDGGRLQPH